MSRLAGYAAVALVILALMGLFRVSRILLRLLMKRFGKRFPGYTVDHVVLLAFVVLLCGLIALPALCAIIGLLSPDRLPGGILLHLLLVAGSVVLFSFSEDLFGSIRRYKREKDSQDLWSVGRHLRLVILPLCVFLAVGSLLLSPVFYAGLSVILLVFYLVALWSRPGKTASKPDAA